MPLPSRTPSSRSRPAGGAIDSARAGSSRGSWSGGRSSRPSPARPGGFAMLVAIRFLFGAGEAGALPNAARVLREWYPDSSRARAQGIVSAAMLLGGAAAPMATQPLLDLIGWRWTFVIFALSGVAWALAFYCWFRDDPAAAPLDQRRRAPADPGDGEAGRRRNDGAWADPLAGGRCLAEHLAPERADCPVVGDVRAVFAVVSLVPRAGAGGLRRREEDALQPGAGGGSGRHDLRRLAVGLARPTDGQPPMGPHGPGRRRLRDRRGRDLRQRADRLDCGGRVLRDDRARSACSSPCRAGGPRPRESAAITSGRCSAS